MSSLDRYSKTVLHTTSNNSDERRLSFFSKCNMNTPPISPPVQSSLPSSSKEPPLTVYSQSLKPQSTHPTTSHNLFYTLRKNSSYTSPPLTPLNSSSPLISSPVLPTSDSKTAISSPIAKDVEKPELSSNHAINHTSNNNDTNPNNNNNDNSNNNNPLFVQVDLKHAESRAAELRAELESWERVIKQLESSPSSNKQDFQSPTPSLREKNAFTNEDFVMGEGIASMKHFKAVSLSKIIDLVTSTMSQDSDFIDYFIFTFRDYGDPFSFAQLFIKRFETCMHSPISSEIQSNVISILGYWISALSSQELQQVQLNECLLSFFSKLPASTKDGLEQCLQNFQKASSVPLPSHRYYSSPIQTRVINNTTTTTNTNSILREPSSSFLTTSSSNNSNNNNVTHPRPKIVKHVSFAPISKPINTPSAPTAMHQVSPTRSRLRHSQSTPIPNFHETNNVQAKLESSVSEVAMELTFLFHELLASINLREFHNQAWSKMGMESNASGILSFTRHFNRLSNWMSARIISKETAPERAAVIEWLVNVGFIMLKELRNFNGVMIVLSALNNSAVSRLKQSWVLVSSKAHADLDEMDKLMLPEKNFKRYRKLLASVPINQPCIPYLGLFLTDYLYMDESNPPFILSNNLVNIDRIYLIGNFLREFRSFQRRIYEVPNNYTPNRLVRDVFLREDHSWNEKEMFALSHLRETSISPSFPRSTDAYNSSSLNSSITVRGKRGAAQFLQVLKSSDSLLDLFEKDFTSPIKGELTERDWALLMTNVRRKAYSKGDVIIKEGAVSTKLYRVVCGCVSIEKGSKKGFERKSSGRLMERALSSIESISNSQEEGSKAPVDKSPGNKPNQTLLTGKVFKDQIFGEMALLNRDRSPISAIADDETTVLDVFDTSFMLKLFETEPLLAATFYKHIAISLANRFKNGAHSLLSVDLPNKSSRFSFTSSPEISGSGDINCSLNENCFGESLTMKDREFSAMFELPREEILIKEFPCKYSYSVQGTLFLSKHYLCFRGKAFGLTKQRVISFNEISDVAGLNDKLIIRVDSSNKKGYTAKKFSFKSDSEMIEVFSFVRSIWNRFRFELTPPCSPPISLHSSDSPFMENSPCPSPSAFLNSDGTKKIPSTPTHIRTSRIHKGLPDKDEWETLFKGSNKVTFKKGDIIVSEGDTDKRVYQIINGCCSVEKNIEPSNPSNSNSTSPTSSSDNSTTNNNNNDYRNDNNDNLCPREVVNRLAPGDIFGEITFLIGGKSWVSVVAETDSVDVYLLEPNFVNALLHTTPNLAPKFYRFLAITLMQRIQGFSRTERTDNFNINNKENEGRQ